MSFHMMITRNRDGQEVEVEAEFTYRPGSPGGGDPVRGVYDPPEPPEVEFLVPEDLTDEECEALYERACDVAEDALAAQAEARYEGAFDD